MTTPIRRSSCLIFLTILALQIQPGDCQCSGTPLVLIANTTYQSFTTPNYPYNYPDNQDCIWIIQAQNVTDAIRLESEDTSIEYHSDCAYDKVEVYDGQNISANSLKKICGTSTPNIVSSGNYLTVAFTSDYSLSSRGYKGRYKSGERSSLLDDEEETETINFLLIAGAALGLAILLSIIFAVIYACHQMKKAKRSRQVWGLEPQDALPAYQMEYIHPAPAPPPAYGDFYASPLSPPPTYREVDPNPITAPSRAAPLPRALRNGANRGHDVSANTHFIAPSYFRDSGAVSHPPPNLSPYPEPNTDRQPTPYTGEIPGQPFNTVDSYDTNDLTTNETTTSDETHEPNTSTTTRPQDNGHTDDANAHTGNVATNAVPGHTAQPVSNVAQTGHANARTNGAMSVHGPIEDSNPGRRMSEVSDMSLPASLCSDERERNVDT